MRADTFEPATNATSVPKPGAARVRLGRGATHAMCACALVLAGAAHAVAGDDFDGDGVFDQIDVVIGFDEITPMLGSVTITSGATGLILF